MVRKEEEISQSLDHNVRSPWMLKLCHWVFFPNKMIDFVAQNEHIHSILFLFIIRYVILDCFVVQ